MKEEGSEYISEAHLLAVAAATKPKTPDPAVEIAHCKGQNAMLHTFLENGTLKEKVARQEREITDLKAQVWTRDRLEKEAQNCYYPTADDVDRIFADTMRELDQESQRKRPRVDRTDIDDFQRVVRNCAERTRCLLRQLIKQPSTVSSGPNPAPRLGIDSKAASVPQ